MPEEAPVVLDPTHPPDLTHTLDLIPHLPGLQYLLTHRNHHRHGVLRILVLDRIIRGRLHLRITITGAITIVVHPIAKIIEIQLEVIPGVSTSQRT